MNGIRIDPSYERDNRRDNKHYFWSVGDGFPQAFEVCRRNILHPDGNTGSAGCVPLILFFGFEEEPAVFACFVELQNSVASSQFFAVENKHDFVFFSIF